MNCPHCGLPMQLYGSYYWHVDKTKKCPITSIPYYTRQLIEQDKGKEVCSNCHQLLPQTALAVAVAPEQVIPPPQRKAYRPHDIEED